MIKRRSFLKKTLLTSAGLAAFPLVSKSKKLSEISKSFIQSGDSHPLVISTWQHGLAANEKAWEIIASGGAALDAAEQGVMVTEADPETHSVGYGGIPDRDGVVTLDACIMDNDGNCGSVCFLQDIKHPISVARLVMEKTPHVMLSGEGALRFALENGFQRENLLTEEAKKQYQKWKLNSEYKPEINIENHDTIGMLAIDMHGKLAGACTTSGMAYKIHGRVGDSPIIGAGLYVDGEVGASVATGHGEYVMKTLGTFLVVELMRNGMTPGAACKEAVKRISKKSEGNENVQVGFLAINNQGEHGAYALRKGFDYALFEYGKNQMVDSGYMREWKKKE